MDIMILTSITKASVPYYSNRDEFIIIGTHDGIFHSDDVLAVAMLCLKHQWEKIRIVRSRDPEDLKNCNICVDVGGGLYDHHQPGFNKCRESNIPYASAGLVWQDYGEELVLSELIKISPNDIEFSKNIANLIDDEIISLVDCEDNGIKANPHCFNFINSYLPIWTEEDPDFNEQFMKVLSITIDVLQHEIINSIASYMAKELILSSWKNERYFSNNILKIPSQTMPWLETIVSINNSLSYDEATNEEINFVIFRHPTGDWAAQSVPPSLEEKFKKRISFPKEWAGETTNLPEISHVKDATFCHNGCFFARAKTKEAIIEMCKIATEYAKK